MQIEVIAKVSLEDSLLPSHSHIRGHPLLLNKQI